jgi:membrane dipeptidase
MNLRLFDLHCDTVLEAYEKKLDINRNGSLHISLDKSGDFSVYTQVFAVWSRHGCDPEELWNRFFEVKKYLDALMPAKRCETEEECDPNCVSDECVTRPNFTYILAMEGGAPVNGDLTRLELLYNAGVRILTPVWKGSDAIGGAYDTKEGLTEYGRALVRRCLELGIAPDVSHASDRMTAEIIELCSEHGRPPLASHSNSRSVYGHPRGLTDENFKALVSAGGIAGVNLVADQLAETRCGIENVAVHIERFLELGGEGSVAVGCDFDGTDSLPDGIHGIGDLYKLAEKLGQYNYSDELIDKVFYANGRKYFDRLLN